MVESRSSGLLGGELAVRPLVARWTGALLLQWRLSRVEGCTSSGASDTEHKSFVKSLKMKPISTHFFIFLLNSGHL